MPSRNVSKYFMPDSVYEKRPATVLAYKKAHQIGRFNPFAETYLEIRVQDMWREVLDRSLLCPWSCPARNLYSKPFIRH